MLLNSIVKNPHFKKSSLYASFSKEPLSFIDIGAAGSVHPLITSFASLTNCTCFEPSKRAYEELLKKYEKKNPFSKINILNTAVSNEKTVKKLYVTKREVNTSLLEPSDKLLNRYNLAGFQIKKTVSVKTDTIDEIIFRRQKKNARLGEFIKMDCQGAEYNILEGAERALNERCVTLYLETEFFKMYKNQKIFSEIDLFLRDKGFQLYGIYPHYISTKKLDRKRYDSEERILWADALYFKDCLNVANNNSEVSIRDIEVLLITAILTRFYDFALEILERYYKDKDDYHHIKNLITDVAESDKKIIEDGVDKLIKDVDKFPEKKYLLAKKFIDEHKSNNSVDFINI